MAFEAYDFRQVNRNVLVTPEIRARLYHMKPGQIDSRHSHDLGHEVFLILQGKAEFTIEGETKVLGPGEMCIALADEVHQVRNLLDDEPTIMYLSVTPHIKPTHTGRTKTGERLPHHFPPNRAYDLADPATSSADELLSSYLEAVTELGSTAQTYVETQVEMADRWRQALKDGDRQTAIAARNAMASTLHALYRKLSSTSTIWNALAHLADEL